MNFSFSTSNASLVHAQAQARRNAFNKFTCSQRSDLPVIDLSCMPKASKVGSFPNSIMKSLFKVLALLMAVSRMSDHTELIYAAISLPLRSSLSSERPMVSFPPSYNMYVIINPPSALHGRKKTQVCSIRLNQTMTSPKLQDLLSQIFNNIPKSTHFGLKVLPTNTPPPFSPQEELNILTDALARKAQTLLPPEMKPRSDCLHFPEQQISIVIQRNKVTSRLPYHIANVIHGPTITNYLSEKEKWTPLVFNSVSWDSFKIAFNKLTTARQIFTSKTIYRFWCTNARHKRDRGQNKELCFCGYEDEDLRHILTCQGTGALIFRIGSWAQFCTKMNKWKIHKDIWSRFDYGILHYNTVEVNVCLLVDYELLKKSPPSKDALRTSFKVYQSGKLMPIPKSRVRDVAFIFTISYIEESHKDLVGIKNMFYMHFQKLSEDCIVKDIPPSHCLPFVSSYCKEHQHMFCLNSQLWNDGKMSRKCVIQAVNKKSPKKSAGSIVISNNVDTFCRSL
jgi:hypothetical protein